MKYGIFFGLFLLFNMGAAQAQNMPAASTPAGLMTTKFKVYGNCGMCEQRIEKAAKIKGVKTADWDVDTKILAITFNGKKVTPAKVHKAVAAVGHDTDMVKADDKTYAKLHACCQYDRAQ
jgi:periplasmic mercuric ion binding protein